MDRASLINIYRELYNLPILAYKEHVSEEFFKTCLKGHFFAIVAIYTPEKQCLLIRDLNKSIGWEFPGGYFLKEERIEDAVNRVVFEETGLEIDELEPVAVIKNEFTFGGKGITHIGIAFMALSRGSMRKLPTNFHAFLSKTGTVKMAYQNKKILMLVLDKISQKTHETPFNEIEHSKKHFRSLIFHKLFVKPIGSLASNKVERQVIRLISGNPKSILDVSCGNSSLISNLQKRFNPEICIGNDISWKTVASIKDKNKNVIFTNHDLQALPYHKFFDLIIFKNTLHHINKRDQKKVIESLIRRSRQLILVDIEDPTRTSWFARLCNIYYVKALGDQGENFLLFKDFQRLILECSFGKHVIFGRIETIKGEYCYASVS